MSQTRHSVSLFGADHAVVGMVHVGALPGTPNAHQNLEQIMTTATQEAQLLSNAGVDALLLENMHDVPYLLREVGPEITASMTAVACAVRSCVDIPLGIQILAGANHAALAVALASNAQFIRAEGFVFAHTADEGIMAKAAAGDLLRYRRTIGAQKIAVWADIKKKHAAHALTADVDLAETAQAADFFGADALIVTGAATGKAANIDDLRVATAASQKPIVVGSGVHSDSVEALWPVCDAFIVGSSLKQGGIWSNPVDETRVELFMYRVRNQRTLALRGTLQSSR